MVEIKGGDCPLRHNFAQEQFIISCYRAEQAGRPAYDFWNTPNWLKQGMGILARMEADEQEQQRHN